MSTLLHCRPYCSAWHCVNLYSRIRRSQDSRTENKDRQFDIFFVILWHCKLSYDNLRCHQWRQNYQIDDLFFSVSLHQATFPIIYCPNPRHLPWLANTRRHDCTVYFPCLKGLWNPNKIWWEIHRVAASGHWRCVTVTRTMRIVIFLHHFGPVYRFIVRKIWNGWELRFSVNWFFHYYAKWPLLFYKPCTYLFTCYTIGSEPQTFIRYEYETQSGAKPTARILAICLQSSETS